MVDLIARMLERNGSENYLVTIAGSGRCRGVNEQGGKWRIGIETPYDNNFSDRDLQRIAEVTDISYTTSGNYRRFYYTPDGRKIAHDRPRHRPERRLAAALGHGLLRQCRTRRRAGDDVHVARLGTRRGEGPRTGTRRGDGLLHLRYREGRRATARRIPDDYETWASPALEKNC